MPNHADASPPTAAPRSWRPLHLATALVRRGIRWHWVYFALAAFNVLTVSSSLYLNNLLVESYQGSVAENRQWAERLGAIVDLVAYASAVNAPANAAATMHLRSSCGNFFVIDCFMFDSIFRCGACADSARASPKVMA